MVRAQQLLSCSSRTQAWPGLAGQGWIVAAPEDKDVPGPSWPILLLPPLLAAGSQRQAVVPGKAAANENRLLSLSCNYFIRLRHALGRAGMELEPWP